jgi:(E)-4-hydroxy-3-methylbut-2-enyl-diphosphate synthase
MRRKSRETRIGDILIGGSHTIPVQSMTKTDTHNVWETISEIHRLEEAGCEIVRIAIPDMEAAESISKIKKEVHIPIVCDIHFDPRLAIASIEKGADKIRLNPSNITEEGWIKKIASLAKERGIPIRVGANIGSLKQKPKSAVDALVDGVLEEVRILEGVGFSNIVISIKSSDVLVTISANEKIASLIEYPIHLGITEAGVKDDSLIKSSLGIGYLLREGIGDTIRFSITGDPVEEVKAGFTLLRSLGLRKRGLEIISCPTCGRAEIDILGLVRKTQRDFGNVVVPLKVAIMGCVVNGPGEARDADIGITGGNGVGVIFKKGKVFKTVKENSLYRVFKHELQKLVSKEEKSLNISDSFR